MICRFNRYKNYFGPALCALIAIFIQIQASIGVNAGYKGIRLNLADPLLPLAGVVVLVSLLRGTSRWPHWRIKGGLIWPLLMSAVVTLSLFIGYNNGHGFSHWALINKYVGWFVLMAYFGLGAWLAANDGVRAARAFLPAFTIIFGLIMCGSLIVALYIVSHDLQISGTDGNWRLMKGLMGNRNAFALLTMFATALVAGWQMKAGPHNRPALWAMRLFWLALPMVLVYNASRAGGLAALIVLTCILFRFGRPTLRAIILPLMVGIILIAGLWTVYPHTIPDSHQAEIGRSIVSGNISIDRYKDTAAWKGDDHVRMTILHDSLALWQESPILGVGLGSFLRYEKNTNRFNIHGLNVIDSTPLWLLTETGLVGLTVFVGFFLFCLPPLWRKDEPDADLNALRFAVFTGLIAFAFMALFHELLYSRYLWFALGLALGRPNQISASDVSSK